MLILGRRAGQEVVINPGRADEVRLLVTGVNVRQGSVRIGFTAPPEVTILRRELVGQARPAGDVGEPRG